MLISLITLGSSDQLSGGYLYHRRLADAAPSHDAEIVFASFPVRPFPLSAWRAGEVAAQAQQPGTDLVLIDSIAAALLAPWLCIHKFDSPLVAVLHQPPGGIDHGRIRTSVQAAFDRSAYRKAACLLAASQALADDLESAGFAPDRLRVVPPGRDVAASDGSFVDLRGGRQAAFLCVGNWLSRKGILPLLDAFARLAPPIATLHLVGDQRVDPAYGARVQARLAAADLAGRIEVHGPVTKERVATLYEAADVFVLPSWKEPYGTVYGEAMAAGLPVVGWRAGNLVNLATDGQEGLLVSPGDVDALAGALERLATDAAFRHRLAAGALRRSQSLPTWDDTARLFFSCLHEVIERVQ